VKSGALPATVYIWRDGMAEWQPYNEVRKPSGPALRVAMPVAVPTAAAPVYEEPEPEAEPEVQGSTRLESISSWGMVSVVLVAMFVFIGLLAGRSHAETRRYGGSATRGKSLHPSLKLRGSSLSVSNGATFDWPLTMILLKSGAETYAYKLPSLPQQEAIEIPLENFATTDGEKFSAAGSGPMDFAVISSGYAVSQARFNKR
jgi:hypothetical protein